MRTFLKNVIKNTFNRYLVNKVSFEENISIKPVSDIFGIDRGTPLDRIYIENFLKNNKKLIQGNCLEVEEATYTNKFAQGQYISNVLKYTSSDTNNKNELVADLSKPKSIPEEKYDSFICTQTLNFVYEKESVVESIHKLLKPGGHAFITVGGISQISRYDYDRWGDFWRFTDQSLLKLLSERFEHENCTLITYGNVATSCLFLQGLAYEDVTDKSIFDSQDSNYQMIVCALVRK